MDPASLKIVAQVAGVAGIALAVFLTLYRDVIRKQIFPMLTKQQAFRLLTLVLVLVWTVALAGIGAWVWISLDNRRSVGPETHDPNRRDQPDRGLVGEWLVNSTGALPETFTQQMKKDEGPEGGNAKKEPDNDMEKSIGDLKKAFGGLVKAGSQSGSFVLQLDADNTYKISKKSGIFEESVSDPRLLPPSGTWTFSRADSRLVLIAVGGGIAPSFTLKTIEKDRLVDENFGRMCVFVRQR